MPKYRVQLNGTAYMKQVQYVEAKDKLAAENKALEAVNDNVWDYVELTDEEILVDVKEEGAL
jgi:hypothetical protein